MRRLSSVWRRLRLATARLPYAVVEVRDGRETVLLRSREQAVALEVLAQLRRAVEAGTAEAAVLYRVGQVLREVRPAPVAAIPTALGLAAMSRGAVTEHAPGAPALEWRGERWTQRGDTDIKGRVRFERMTVVNGKPVTVEAQFQASDLVRAADGTFRLQGRA